METILKLYRTPEATVSRILKLWGNPESVEKFKAIQDPQVKTGAVETP